jgi:hypothetical protein
VEALFATVSFAMSTDIVWSMAQRALETFHADDASQLQTLRILERTAKLQDDAQGFDHGIQQNLLVATHLQTIHDSLRNPESVYHVRREAELQASLESLLTISTLKLKNSTSGQKDAKASTSAAPPDKAADGKTASKNKKKKKKKKAAADASDAAALATSVPDGGQAQQPLQQPVGGLEVQVHDVTCLGYNIMSRALQKLKMRENRAEDASIVDEVVAPYSAVTQALAAVPAAVQAYFERYVCKECVMTTPLMLLMEVALVHAYVKTGQSKRAARLLSRLVPHFISLASAWIALVAPDKAQQGAKQVLEALLAVLKMIDCVPWEGIDGDSTANDVCVGVPDASALLAHATSPPSVSSPTEGKKKKNLSSEDRLQFAIAAMAAQGGALRFPGVVQRLARYASQIALDTQSAQVVLPFLTQTMPKAEGKLATLVFVRYQRELQLNQARLLYTKNRFQQTVVLLTEHGRGLEAVGGSASEQVARRNNLGCCYMNLNQPAMAVYCFLAALTGSVESMGDVMVGATSNNVLSAIRELTIELGAAAGGGDDTKASPSKSNGGGGKNQTTSVEGKLGIDGTHLTRDRNVEVGLTHRLTVLRNLGLALRAQGNYPVAYICLQETMRWRANDLLEPASMPEHLFKQAWLRVRMAECCVHSFAACKQTQERKEVNQYAQRTLRVNLDSMASLESLHERRSTTFPCGSTQSAREQPLSVNARSGNWSDAAYRATDVVKKSVLQGNASAMDINAAVRNSAMDSDANNDWHQRMATEKDVQSSFLNLDIYDTNTPNQALNMENASALLYSVMSTLPRLPATGPLAADATVLRAQVYVNLMYVSLSLGDSAAVPWLYGEWQRLLRDADGPQNPATERVIGPLRLVANMYAAEAFLQLGQGSRALAVLDSKRLNDAAMRNPIALESGFGAGADAKRGDESADATPAAFVEPEDDEDSEADAASTGGNRGKRGWKSSELNVKELEHALLGIASGDGDSVTPSPARKAADASASMVLAVDRMETGSGRYDRTGANALYAVHSGADHVNTTTDDARYHEGYPKALLLTNHAEVLMQAGRFSEGLLVCKQAAEAISPLELPSTQRLRLALLLKLNRYEHATQEFLNARRLPYIKG